MTIIGEASVLLKPDLTGFGSGLNSKIQGLINPSGAGGVGGAASKLGAGVAGGLVLAGVAAVDLGMKMQDADAKIQGSLDTTAKKAKAIGDDFLDTAGKSMFSGREMAQAFAPVAGQLQAANGGVLTAAQSLGDMTAASKLAAATNNDLKGNTAALANVMQAYGIQAAGAGDTTNTLFNIARITGSNVGDFTTAVDRLHAKLGDLAPSLGDVGALMVDLAAHGTTGSRGVMTVSSGLEHLITASDAVGPSLAKAIGSGQKAVESANKRVADAQAHLATEQQRIRSSPSGQGIAAQTALANAQQRLSDAQDKVAESAGKLHDAQTGANKTGGLAVQTAQQLGIKLYTTSGAFIGMRAVIEQLQPKLQKMTEQQRDQALISLFGAGAAQQLGQVVLGGTAAWDKAATAVQKKGAVDRASAAAQKTLHGEMKTFKATVEDLGTKLGEALIPKLTDLGKKLADVVGWFEKHKTVAKDLAIIIGGVLTTAFVTWAVTGVASMVSGLVTSTASLLGFQTSAETSAAGIEVTMDTLLASIEASVAGIAESMGVAVDAAAVEMDVAGAAGEAAITPFIVEAAPFIAVAALIAGAGYLIYRNWGTIKRLFGDLVSFIKEHWKGIAEILIAPFAPFLVAFLLFHKQITGAIGDIIDWFKKLPGKIVGYIGDAGRWLYQAGKDVIHGLIKGLEDMAGDLVKAIEKHIIDPVIHNPIAKWILGSPSHLFAEYGANLMQGLSLGISTNSHLPVNAMKALNLTTPSLAAGGAGSSGSPVLNALGQLVAATKENTHAVAQSTQQAQKPVKATLTGRGNSGVGNAGPKQIAIALAK